ncbi:cyclic nucleotide-binding domain-containing protein [bacterium]|nr:cyclic nucleotide-binding domain-containing protein [bacterium]
MALLSRRATLRVEPADRVIVQSGEAGGSLFFVLEGLLVVEAARRTAGRAGTPSMLRPGDLFDPPVVLLGQAHANTLRTRTPVLLCELDQNALQNLFGNSSTALAHVGDSLAKYYPSKINTDDENSADEIVRQLRYMFPLSSTPAHAADG